MPSVQNLLQQAVQIHKAGQVHEAAKLYREVLKQDPKNADAFHLLGLTRLAEGALEDAKANIQNAIRLNSKAPLYFSNLGNVQTQLYEYDEAIGSYRKALHMQNDFPDAEFNMALCLQKRGELQEAKLMLEKLTTKLPRFAKAQSALSSVYKNLGEYDKALQAVRTALQLDPKLSEAHTNFGNILYEKAEFSESIKEHQSAIQMGMRSDIAFSNLGLSYQELGDYQEAEESYRKSIASNPSFFEAHWNLATVLLLNRKYPEAWREYLLNWNRPEKKLPTLSGKLWNGERSKASTIYIYSEQGLGDSIQFSRYINSLKDNFGFENVFLGIQDCLRTALSSLEENAIWLKKNDPLPAFDFFSPLPRIPAFFEKIPEPSKIAISDSKRKFWRERLNSLPGKLKIGFAWQGNPNYPHDKWRSIPFSIFKNLFESSEASWICLHNTESECQKLRDFQNQQVFEFQNELDKGPNAFEDTSALMKELDLIVTSDTSLPHLSGSIGAPTWLLVKRSPDWRWGAEGEACDWYSSIRIFRQREWGNWDELISRVRNHLEKEFLK